MLALEVKKLNKRYRNFQLADVSFQLEQGYIMGFIGANGAGKTTTIKSILNLIQTDGGEINTLGRNFIQHELELKQEIGYAFGGIDFYTRSKIKTLTHVVKAFYRDWDEKTYRYYLARFKLNENQKIAELSSGMKVKYSLALALSHHAKLLILDEPTSGLDPAARDDLLDLFQELVEPGEISILFSTHITSDLEKCADYITFIDQGRIINSLDKEAFIDAYRLVNGKESQLQAIQSRLIAYKLTSFGFTGLIHAQDLDPAWGVRASLPSLEEIMIYFAKKGAAHV